MAYLILIRHGESEWNAQGLWTGLTDIPLSEKGKQEAQKAVEMLKNIPLNIAYTSTLSRAKETLEIIKKSLRLNNLPTIESQTLNERDYGVYTGKNKWEIKEKLGEEEFKKLRRSFDYPIKNGESLKDVYNRVIPYYKTEILPKLIEGKSVIISAHGNSLRSLVKFLENISDNDISNLEIATGEIYIYQIDENGKIV
ncbi:MAG: 2,3-diphosphoglycerate-dependent phosphoglycerate mutase, partial [Candidatus Levybacteria bacterium]|nr:2,3-diphosphoglycerate-dependent phosphoglycerate mutase [Candidatus Levybacteria bacterium]